MRELIHLKPGPRVTPPFVQWTLGRMWWLSLLCLCLHMVLCLCLSESLCPKFPFLRRRVGSPGLQNHHADGDCSHEIKRHLLLGRKTMTNLDCMLKSRDITLPTKIHLVKPMVFPIVRYGCESWTIKKAEHQKLMLLKCGVEEDSWESLGLQGDPTSPFWRRSTLGFLWKEWC